MTPNEWQALLGVSIWVAILTSWGAISIALKRRRRRRHAGGGPAQPPD